MACGSSERHTPLRCLLGFLLRPQQSPLFPTSGLFIVVEGPISHLPLLRHLNATHAPGLIFLFLWVYVLQFKSTPDLLRDQQEAAPPGSVDHLKATIYSILREGCVGALPGGQSHTSLLLLLVSFSIFLVLSSPFPHLCCLFPPLSFASVLSSSRSSESETSVKRKVSLVLEQMQPLVVSGCFLGGGWGGGGWTGLGPLGPGVWMWTHPFPPYPWQMPSGSTKALGGQGELTRKVEELQQKLDEEVKVRGDWRRRGNAGHGRNRGLGCSSKQWNKQSCVL